MNVLFGLSASSGIGIGRAFVIPEAEKRVISSKKIKNEEKPKQLVRFERSLAKVVGQIAEQLEIVKDDKTQSEIFETYFLMLNDPEFLGDVRKTFDESNFSIEYVLNQKTEEYADRLRSSGNAYLAERAEDICDIFGRVLNDLLDFHPFNIENIPDDVVIIARSMAPSDTVILSKRRIAGIALTDGGVSSHVGILARNYGIPAVFDIESILDEIAPDSLVIVDGDAGEIIEDPDEKTLEDYQKKIEIAKEHEKRLKKFRDIPAKTKDGELFHLMANIGTVDEARVAMHEGADGIGLFRTEFLFMSEVNNNMGSAHSKIAAFSEENQFIAYKTVLETMKGKPVTIRTLDAGGDKIISALDITHSTSEEKNPLMGLRAIRLTLANPQLLRTQFRALYRASVFGNLKIMLPLITSVEQVEEALAIAAKVRDELRVENIPFNPAVPIGIMIETAAAAMISDCLANVSDFFSIGTNDLTQYTIGVDRENSLVAPLYDEFHLAVLRLLDKTISEANKAGISVSVCGEMASRAESVMVLAGMGVRTLSMSPKLITKIKELLSKISMEELKSISSKRINSL
ncbi:MAG: phosphoenolpyruvate--protein phosphotransferase [Treponema sp.]|uniref:phosphoenolpyruvate--protein phosphotransferase n=1 Tax=Treponema sp. TaxID=166 RepID=UPI0025DFE2B7|nr:phosphoenolpyruvate--protein phosphotransferase [Treponema sp.]MBQ9621840.1 phosphoenolpyruvate--protein phosphotransferase [Treponema sp.]MBR0497175.1 phosphoenolpyruvate--protein phosphotransferase [Treponema sp.]